FAAQIFQTFADIELFSAILLLHSLETSSAFAHWTACGERPRLTYTPPHRRGNCGSLLYVLRDTPHARVSVSYVLEASLLNDRVQLESGRKITWKRTGTRASLGASIAQAF